MVWRLKGDRPVPKPKLIQIPDAIWFHKITMSYTGGFSLLPWVVWPLYSWFITNHLRFDIFYVLLLNIFYRTRLYISHGRSLCYYSGTDRLPGELKICIFMWSKKKMQSNKLPNGSRLLIGITQTTAHFTNYFSIVIQFRWKLYSALVQLMIMWSLWHFAHGMTVALSWHVQTRGAIWYPTMELH